jgi:hypothetical protein
VRPTNAHNNTARALSRTVLFGTLNPADPLTKQVWNIGEFQDKCGILCDSRPSVYGGDLFDEVMASLSARGAKRYIAGLHDEDSMFSVFYDGKGGNVIAWVWSFRIGGHARWLWPPIVVDNIISARIVLARSSTFGGSVVICRSGSRARLFFYGEHVGPEQTFQHGVEARSCRHSFLIAVIQFSLSLAIARSVVVTATRAAGNTILRPPGPRL